MPLSYGDARPLLEALGGTVAPNDDWKGGLPITYLNIGASYMDNFIRIAEITRRTKSLVWPQRYIPYIDPREVGNFDFLGFRHFWGKTRKGRWAVHRKKRTAA
jgi:hypothetical protein